MSKQVNVSSIESFSVNNEASKNWVFSKDAFKVEQMDNGVWSFPNKYLRRTDEAMVLFAYPWGADEKCSTGLVTYGDKNLNYIDRTGQEFTITAEEGYDLVVLLGLGLDTDFGDDDSVEMPELMNVWFWAMKHDDTASEMARNNPEAFRRLVSNKLVPWACCIDDGFQVYLVDAGLRSRLLRPSHHLPSDWKKSDRCEYIAPINGTFLHTEWGREARREAASPISKKSFIYQVNEAGSGLYSNLYQS